MFGFGKKKKDEFEEGFKNLPEVRGLLKDLLGEALNVYMGVTVSYLMNFGKTKAEVEKAKTEMLNTLQKYVQAEILLERQKHGRAPSLEELVFLRPR